MHLNRISKPLLVDLLRVFHNRKWLSPHIRFASVRSKPELCKDLANYFDTALEGDFIRFRPKNHVPQSVPRLDFDLKHKRFLFDLQVIEVPILSRNTPRFRISHEPVTLYFGAKGDPPAK